MKRNINGWLERRSQQQLLCLSIVLATTISLLDYAVQIDLSLSTFYLVPIVIAAWYVDLRSGIALSLLCSLAWFWADIAAKQYGIILLPIWNAGIRLSFFVIVSYLISLQKQAYRREMSFARIDGLTGVHNDRFFKERLKLEIERSRRSQTAFVLAYIDLDNFKAINDRFGHREGDLVLKALAQQLKAMVRAGDIIGRLGGDEFVILFSQIEMIEIHSLLKRIQTQLQTSLSSRWPVGFSVGAVVFVESPPSVEIAIAHADQVMYSIKKSGKNRLELQMVPQPNSSV